MVRRLLNNRATQLKRTISIVVRAAPSDGPSIALPSPRGKRRAACRGWLGAKSTRVDSGEHRRMPRRTEIRVEAVNCWTLAFRPLTLVACRALPQRLGWRLAAMLIESSLVGDHSMPKADYRWDFV